MCGELRPLCASAAPLAGGRSGARARSPTGPRRRRRAFPLAHARWPPAASASAGRWSEEAAARLSAGRKLPRKAKANKLATTSNQNFDMRHRPNESTHTEAETANRLLSSCSPRAEQEKLPRFYNLGIPIIRKTLMNYKNGLKLAQTRLRPAGFFCCCLRRDAWHQSGRHS